MLKKILLGGETIKKIILIFTSLFLLTSCTNYELNNIAIVDSIGIDKEDNTYLITFNIYEENDKYQTIELKENNLDNTFSDIYTLINKKIYLSHLNLLFFSTNLTSEDITKIFNVLSNENNLRTSFNILFIKDYNQDIFNNTEEVINLLNTNYNETGIIYPTTFNELTTSYLDYGISYLPLLNSKLEVIGMHSIFNEYKEYDSTNSLILNILMNKVNNFSLEDIKLTNSKTTYKINKNNVTININFTNNSTIDNDEIKKYLKNKIDNFLYQEYNDNYFLNLIEKYDYSYYKNNSNIKINYTININLNTNNTNNKKEDDTFV